jgi:hypothetical protein
MFLAQLAACSDYDLQAREEDAKPGPQDTGTPPAETAVEEEDTGAAEETGTIEQPAEDTGTVATEPVYLNTGSELYGYDPTTNTATLIGHFSLGGTRITDMTDIAIDLSGYMYGCAYDVLYRVNPATAEATLVGRMKQEMNALTFVSDGRLVGASEDVVTIDTSTAKETTLYGGGKWSSSGDIVGLPDGMLYWTVEGGDRLVVIDPTTGSASEVGSIGVTAIYALGYAYGDLYGFTSSGKALVIDPGTASVSSKQNLSGSWWGATTNPVLW